MSVFRIIDVETTGMEPEDEIIELGFIDLAQDDDGTLRIGEERGKLYGTTRGPMSAEVRAVHHITDDMLTGLPSFKISGDNWCPDGVSALVAHNSKYEQQYFPDNGVPWICTYKAALHLWPEAPKHTVQVLRYLLELPVNPERASPPHRAAPDAYVTGHLLAHILENKLADIAQLIAWTLEPKPVHVMPWGKEWKGRKLEEVDIGFLTWVRDKADATDEDLRFAVNKEIERRTHTRSMFSGAAQPLPVHAPNPFASR